MNQLLFSENELFGFTKPSLVLYVEDSYNSELNDFIQTNYKQVVDTFNTKEIDFCYLPYLLEDKNFQEIVGYNRPYLHTDLVDDAGIKIYNRVKQLLTQPFLGVGLVWIDNNNGFSKSAIGCQLIDNKSFVEQFDLFATVIFDLSAFGKQTDVENIPAWKRKLRDSSDDIRFSSLRQRETEYTKDQKDLNANLNICYSIELNADSLFDDEAYRLANEIRTRIRLLKESSSLSLIADILEEIQCTTKQLSPLFITNDYRIFLKDYGMKEVVMPPLPKSLFILFLRHPEGILFKQLADYHDELLSIYRNITVHENIDRAMESIRAMTDPLNNSINEKCSRIRAAFLENITDDLALNYYVTGKRGEPKMIILDRSLVEFQK